MLKGDLDLRSGQHWRASSFPLVRALQKRYEIAKLIVLILVAAGITAANYALPQGLVYYEAFLHSLYFAPLILSGFWFGFRGALVSSVSIIVLCLPIVAWRWNQSTLVEFESLLEIAIYGVVAVMIGILKDRELSRQRRLRDSERLATMGRAVSGLAHDMKTPLIAIGGFVRQVWDRLPEADPDRERLSIVIKETLRLEHMVQDMLDYSGNLRLAEVAANVPQIIEESLAVVKQVAAERNVRLLRRIDGNLPLLTCDGMRIKQMLINLLTNAIDSSPDGALVTVLARMSDAGMILEVIDRGPGIPQEQRHLIFDPFFTTKVNGIGLGLPIVKKIVDAHRAGLEVVDNSEQGLTVRVVLPLAPGRDEI
jgi:two-component system, NtrC family, sensor histidine kinase HydH